MKIGKTILLQRLALCTSISVALFHSASAVAQTAGNAQPAVLDEVIVTAQKREETAQNIPLAIDVIASDALIREGIRDMADITRASTELEANNRGGGQNVTIGIRGMQQVGTATTSETLVAVHLDGSYIASPWGLSGLMYDLDRVEVLAGPQGTLYGRNATAGAVNLITKRPGREFEGNASIEYGDYDAIRVQGGVTVPLTETLSARFAGQKYTRDALYTDGSASQDQWGARLSALWTPSERDELLLSFDYTDYQGSAESGTLVALAPGTPTTNPQNGRSYVVPSDPFNNRPYWDARGVVFTGDRSFMDQWGAMAQYTHTFDGFSATLQYAHRDIEQVAHGANKLPTVFSETLTDNTTTSDTVELRFSSTGNGAFEWVGGLFYLESSTKGFFAAPIGPNADRPIGATTPALTPASPPLNPSYPLDACPCLGGLFGPSDGDTESYALFGQTTWTPESLDKWHFTLGLRYSNDWKNAVRGRPSGNPNLDSDGAGPLPPGYVSYFVSDGKSWNATQYKLGAQYDFSDSSMGYASVSTGYKAGGFASGPTPIVKPEEVLAYEIGTKNRFLENTLQFNAAAWLYKYTDLESNVPRNLSQPYPIGTNGLPITSQNSITSLGEVRLAGLSFDADWLLTPDDRLGVSFTYVYSKVIDGRESATGIQLYYEGERLGDTPEFAALGRYAHTFTLANGATLQPQVKYQWQSEKYDASTIQLTPPGARPFSKRYTTIPSQGILDVSLRFAPASETWDLTAYLNNATDETDIKLLQYGDAPGAVPVGHAITTLGEPRLWGLILGVRF